MFRISSSSNPSARASASQLCKPLYRPPKTERLSYLRSASSRKNFFSLSREGFIGVFYQGDGHERWVGVGGFGRTIRKRYLLFDGENPQTVRSDEAGKRGIDGLLADWRLAPLLPQTISQGTRLLLESGSALHQSHMLQVDEFGQELEQDIHQMARVARLLGRHQFTFLQRVHLADVQIFSHYCLRRIHMAAALQITQAGDAQQAIHLWNQAAGVQVQVTQRQAAFGSFCGGLHNEAQAQ